MIPQHKTIKDVFASTFLGSPEFITWAKEKLIDPNNADTRNIPVLRELVDRPSLEQIGRIIESIIGRKHPFFKKICIYVSHRYREYVHKNITFSSFHNSPSLYNSPLHRLGGILTMLLSRRYSDFIGE
jgi:hypothetical protein